MSQPAENPSILVVEDEELMRNILRKLLVGEGYTVLTADSAEAAIEVFSGTDVAVTLTDIKMGGADGIELLDRIKTINSEAVVIVITAFSSVDSAIAALRKGAFDYITKPFVNDDLLMTVRNAATQARLSKENRFLRRELRRQYSFSGIIGVSESIRSVLDLVRKVADTDAAVLIQGESGTGKELIARAVHFNSRRAEEPFLAVNCGAIPASLLESELFGHVRGAFTGAVTDTTGLFRAAGGGTIFLDEIGEMPAQLQIKLLRALQEHCVTPVGSTREYAIDARIVSATNKDLSVEIAEGRFREDLFYRLNVIDIVVPPLRERREDIPLLVKHFILRSEAGNGKTFSPKAIEMLKSYDWPGNVRELENVVERTLILGDGEIGAAELPAKIVESSTRPSSSEQPTLDDLEQEHIQNVLQRTKGDKAAAARMLGIDLSTLYRKLKRYGK